MIINYHLLARLHAVIEVALAHFQKPTEWRLAQSLVHDLVGDKELTHLLGHPVDVIPFDSRSFLMCDGGFKYVVVEHIDARFGV